MFHIGMIKPENVKFIAENYCMTIIFGKTLQHDSKTWKNCPMGRQTSWSRWEKNPKTITIANIITQPQYKNLARRLSASESLTQTQYIYSTNPVHLLHSIYMTNKMRKQPNRSQ